MLSVEGRPPDDISDDELIRSARSGDDDAFAEIIRRHKDVAYRIAYVVLEDRDAAADAVQDAFISVHRALPRFRDGAPMRPWLARIVGNRARNLRRRAGRQGILGRNLAIRDLPFENVEPSPEVGVVTDEARRELLAVVNLLPEADRVAIGLRYFLDMSEAETAAALDIPLGTVKSRLWRARARLRVLLAKGEVS
jgi:RNA polymerase sigma-70 factor (ECF subfamily)